jgi:hypothetical protein
MSIPADRAHPDGARAWWQRILLVPQAPRAVFAELRDDSRDAAEDRQDAIAAVAFFVGVALTLFSSQASSFADDRWRAGIVIPVWLFIAGLFVGLVNYWLAGGALYLALSRLGAKSSYRQARHVLALAAVPLALLAIGIRVVEGWGWRKTVGAIVAFGLLVAVADLALNLFGG